MGWFGTFVDRKNQQRYVYATKGSRWKVTMPNWWKLDPTATNARLDRATDERTDVIRHAPSIEDEPVAIELGGFSLEVLESLSSSTDQDLARTVTAAIDRYLGDRNLRPPGWHCLPLPEMAPTGRTLAVEVDQATSQEIRAAATAQRVSPAALVVHALMYLWAAERPDGAVLPAQSRLSRADRAPRHHRSGSNPGQRHTQV